MDEPLGEIKMTYFEDLSDYTYGRDYHRRQGTINVGWLDPEHEFEQAVPSETLLDAIWSYCKISVASARGIHECQFCKGEVHRAQRNEERLLLGMSEIRVFGTNGRIFAAPTLIYHYIESHHYSPPREFTQAVLTAVAPPSREYFAQLEALDLEWRHTSVPDINARRFEWNGERFEPVGPQSLD